MDSGSFSCDLGPAQCRCKTFVCMYMERESVGRVGLELHDIVVVQHKQARAKCEMTDHDNYTTSVVNKVPF